MFYNIVKKTNGLREEKKKKNNITVYYFESTLFNNQKIFDAHSFLCAQSVQKN